MKRNTILLTIKIILSIIGKTNENFLQSNKQTRVVILGSGTAVIYKENVYLIDAGPDIVRAAKRAGIKEEQMNLVFLTHLHSDHTIGLVDLILAPPAFGRNIPLTIYGPPGTKKMQEKIIDAYEEDIYIRLKYQPETIPEAFKAVAHEISDQGLVYSDLYMKVFAFNVTHGNFKYSFGYKFVTVDGSTIVISGDTNYNENLIEMALNCDILIHETYPITSRSKEWEEYFSNYHTSTIELGLIAQKAQPKQLVLYHVVQHGVDKDKIVAQIQEKFKGNIIYAND